jgi:enamine deaminase RidA (YjgF/YER057c/UK114 family)
LAGVGVRPEEVIAVRMSITDRAFAEDVGLAHGEVFGTIRPVATMVVVAGLIDPAMLVEVELTAWAD